MFEESRMDKKYLNRSSQSQSRALATDCKKITELTYKPWPRNNKREVSGSVPKNEPHRKNVPLQRGRGQMDKKTKSHSSDFVMGGAQGTGIDEDEEPEIGSVFVPGIKKQNLNHLLNFMYPTRGVPERKGPRPHRQVQNRVSYRHEHDLYLRAYCQFVVKENGDFKKNLLDPDEPMSWEYIEEIVVRGTGRSECPICLGAPVAARVGNCGHVYCWACVLHYDAAHEKRPPPCPVCATPITVKEMKPTRIVQWESPADEVTMRLVRRLRGSTTVEIAPPRGDVTETTSVLHVDQIKDAPYGKIFTANNKQVYDILKRERKEIENQILAEIDTTEIVFLEQALEMLKKKEEMLNVDSFKSNITAEAPEEFVPVVYERNQIFESHMNWFDVTEEGAACVENIQGQMEELEIANVESALNPNAPSFSFCDNGLDEEFPLTDCFTEIKPEEVFTMTDTDKDNQSKYFYFYQAEDGQQVFLNSLNVRILNASWGGLAAAPPTIRGRVLHRETLSLSEQTRKHMPCTAHLPLYCAFDIVELDLKPPYVTTAALKNFTEELDRRARTRARHEREERRRERAYRRAMEGPPKPDFSDAMFPPAMPYSSPPLDSTPFTQEEAIPSTSATPPSAGPSFAKMAASSSGKWRVRKSAAPPPNPPDDDEVTTPRALILSDAIEAALLAAPSTSHSGKKKKSKQKVLFTTGMQRAL